MPLSTTPAPAPVLRTLPSTAVSQAREKLLESATLPLASNPTLRQSLIDLRRSYDQVIDEVSQDTVISAGYTETQALNTVESFKQFIEDNRDEITALQVLYQRPYRQRLGYDDIRALADALQAPPRSWTTEQLWRAYQQLDQSRVRGSGPRVLSDIVSLVRYAIGQADELAPFEDAVRQRFQGWLAMQETAGRAFTPEAGTLARRHPRPHRRQRQHRHERLPVLPLLPTGRAGPSLQPLRRRVGRPTRRAELRARGRAVADCGHVCLDDPLGPP